MIYKKIISNDKQDVVLRNGFINEKNGLFYAGNRTDAVCCLMNSLLSALTYRKLYWYFYQLYLSTRTCYNASKIAALSSGEFVGLVADNPDEKIKLKMFHAEIINDAKKLNVKVSQYKEIPVVSNVSQQQVLDNYYQVKMEVKRLIGEEVELLKNKMETKNLSK